MSYGPLPCASNQAFRPFSTTPELGSRRSPVPQPDLRRDVSEVPKAHSAGSVTPKSFAAAAPSIVMFARSSVMKPSFRKVRSGQPEMARSFALADVRYPICSLIEIAPPLGGKAGQTIVTPSRAAAAARSAHRGSIKGLSTVIAGFCRMSAENRYGAATIASPAGVFAQLVYG